MKNSFYLWGLIKIKKLIPVVIFIILVGALMLKVLFLGFLLNISKIENNNSMDKADMSSIEWL